MTLRQLAIKSLAPILIGAGLLSSLPADAASVVVRYTASVNYDGTIDTDYLAGNKPEPGASCSTWTCAQLGTAAGEINESAADTLEFAASGNDDLDNYDFAYKSFDGTDAELKVQVPDQANWTGYKGENFVGGGLACRESLSGGWFFNVWSVNVNDTPRGKFGTAGSVTSIQGDPSTALPEYLAITRAYSAGGSTYSSWQSNNGTDWVLVQTTTRDDPAEVFCGAFFTPQETGQSTFVTLTDATSSTTLTINVDPGAEAPTFTAGPTAGTPSTTTLRANFTVDQTGTVYGVACPDGQAAPTVAQVKSGNCTGNIPAVSAKSVAVTAAVANAITFDSLTPSTTYDLSFVPVATLDGAAVTALANQTTSASNPPNPNPGTCSAALASPNNAVYSSGFTRTANVGCRDDNDIVLGWDWSIPAETPIASRGGVFNGNSSVPSYFVGRHLYQCNLRWADIEPTDDAWDDSTIDDCFDPIPAGYDGVMLNVRGTQATIRNCANTQDKHLSEWNAPTWARNIAALVTQNCHTGGDFQIRSINIDNDTTDGPGATGTPHDEYFEFLNHVLAYGYHTQDVIQIIHVASMSRGEECCGGVSSATQNEIIDTWVNGFGATHKWKLAWLKENEPQASYAINTKAIGIRGGIIENWLRTVYTPGQTDLTGQELDANGYLGVDSGFLPISQVRHFADQMEFLNQTDFNYMAAGIRSMQMRRMANWLAQGSAINARQDNWQSHQMGHTTSSTPEAWAWLSEHRGYNGGTIRPLHNLERHLFQREALGATTSTNKVAHGKNNTANNNLPATSASCDFAEPGGGTGNDCYASAVSRRENNAANAIGFALEDAFWSPSLTRDAVVKITFVNNTSATVSVRNSAGTVLDSFTVTNTGASDVRTATLFIDDFTAPASGFGKDFDIHSTSPVDIMFVRVIKNGGTCGGATCATW